jgi:tousled-like kinase
MFDQKMKELQ